jgi:hypothetical protein
MGRFKVEECTKFLTILFSGNISQQENSTNAELERHEMGHDDANNIFDFLSDEF